MFQAAGTALTTNLRPLGREKRLLPVHSAHIDRAASERQRLPSWGFPSVETGVKWQCHHRGTKQWEPKGKPEPTWVSGRSPGGGEGCREPQELSRISTTWGWTV